MGFNIFIKEIYIIGSSLQKSKIDYINLQLFAMNQRAKKMGKSSHKQEQQLNTKGFDFLVQSQNQCPICLQVFDLIRKVPMMICLNQHSSCEQCIQDVYKKKTCPVCCEKLLVKKYVKKNRLLSCLLEQCIRNNQQCFIQGPKLRYRGQMKLGKKHGKGEHITNQGVHYRGFYQNGELKGKCQVFTKDQSRFQGQAENGMLQGVFTTVYGSTISGKFNLNTLEGVECVKKYTNGDVYVGNIKNLKAEGFGKLTFQNGNVFQGTFQQDYISTNSRGTITGTFPITIRDSNLSIQEIQEQILDVEMLEQERRRPARFPLRRPPQSSSDDDSSQSDEDL